MPLLAYFGLVGSILVGLLYVAEAQLGPPPKSVGLSTNFHGLPAPYKEASSSRTRILTVRDAPAPPACRREGRASAVTPICRLDGQNQDRRAPESEESRQSS